MLNVWQSLHSKRGFACMLWQDVQFCAPRCEACGFDLRGLQDHSKVTLMRTDCNWYVLKTSSNLNENPKIEQFIFENDEQLFELYKQNLFEKGEK